MAHSSTSGRAGTRRNPILCAAAALAATLGLACAATALQSATPAAPAGAPAATPARPAPSGVPAEAIRQGQVGQGIPQHAQPAIAGPIVVMPGTVMLGFIE
ncbi:MAG: hypothetical protein FGM37_08620, partial [Phycisphaerales bacterium]|nr:hypothetical protein [Phycisphaerales bacterium]